MGRCAGVWIGLLLALAGPAAASVGSGPSAQELARIPEALPGAPALPAGLRRELARALVERGPDYQPRTAHRRPDGSPEYTNRLLLETSPYLQQHAHNPVNWYAWGDDAFAVAKRLDRPVLVSIGYSTCHWCHVMEDESFDEPEIARYLNENFIAIKVDRELRPDVDAIYMAAIRLMNQGGGWPLNVWVTPDRKPFFGGTYFPPRNVPGRSGFPTVLRSITEIYGQNRARVEDSADRIAAGIRATLEGNRADATRVPGVDTLNDARSSYVPRIDATWGGIGARQKFPATTPIRFLLRYHRRSGDEVALRLASLTLEKMATGGIYDHVGGGFHRYSTDPRWLVPHFEKMLYDNALLVVVYLEAWQATGREDFARTTRDILHYVGREMTAPQGGFYSATDADSLDDRGEAQEGWFFTWTPAEIEAAVGAEKARVVNAFYGVTGRGNHEGRSILYVGRSTDDVARELELSPEALRTSLDAARPLLYEARRRRAAPLLDEKILAAWNGLMISAYARAGFALGEPEYLKAAERAADFVLVRMRRGGRLHRVFKDGHASGPAFLEDYAFVIAGLLDLYEAASDPRWLREALALQQVLDRRYADAAGGGYFQTADDHESLISREKPSRDGAIPSGNSVEALNLLRLTELTGDDRHRQLGVLLFSAFYDDFTLRAAALPEMLVALQYYLDATKEIVVVSPPEDGDLEAMLAPLRVAFVPNRVVSVVTEGEDLEAHRVLVPLVTWRVARSGRVTAYVCENRVCSFPTSDPSVFAEQIRRVKAIE